MFWNKKDEPSPLGVPVHHSVTMSKEIEDEPIDGKAPHAVGARLSR